MSPPPGTESLLRVVLVHDDASDLAMVALEQHLSAMPGAVVRTVRSADELEDALREAPRLVLCPLEGPCGAAATLERAHVLGIADSVVVVSDSKAALAAADALRQGALGVTPSEPRSAVEEGLRRALAQRATRADRARLEHHRRFFDDGPVIVFRWRAAATWPVEYASPNVVQLFGVRAEDFIQGRVQYAQSVHPEDLERVAREVGEHSARGASSFDQEYRIVRPDGEVRWLYDHTIVVRDESGAATHYEGYVFDVTQLEAERRTRAAAERKLLQAQKLESLGVLAGGVAHDFNNLLTTILGEAAIALADLREESGAHSALTNIVAAARSASGLTRQMLTYAGRASSTPIECDIVCLVREVANLLESSLPKNVRLELELGEGALAVRGDPSQIQQVVMNLVLNGAEACGDRAGKVRLSVSRRSGALGGARRECIALEVEDDGQGMDAQTLARVFEPFFTTKFRGRGLGLSAVQGIVRAHGGDFSFDSQPGRGTKARVLLPASTLQVAPAAALPAPNPARGERVLVVDDEAMVARVAVRCLQQFGYSTASAKSGDEALELLAATVERIDCVLLDRTMPGISGEETLRQLRERAPEIAVVLTSGFDESESLLATRRATPDAFLRKPFSPDELARSIRAAIDAARARQAQAGGA